MRISVITPTVRLEGIKLVEKALDRQEFRDFEWIVQKGTSVKKSNCWSLNHDYNLALKKAKGELIVSWQDFTYAKPDTLSKFWFHFTQEPKTLVTGVGNKYKDDKFNVLTWKDPRQRTDQGTYYPCYWNDIEWNLCSCPIEALRAVGGFMEDLDKYYGLDAYCVDERINEIGGYDFKIDQTIESFSLEHGRLSPDWDKFNWLAENRYAVERSRLRKLGKWPVAPYLKTPTL